MTPVSKIATITGAAAFLLGAFLSRPAVYVQAAAAPAAPIAQAAAAPAAPVAAPAAAAPVKKAAAPVKRKAKPRRPIVRYVVYAAPRCTCGI